jgi:hypothetical protein
MTRLFLFLPPVSSPSSLLDDEKTQSNNIHFNRSLSRFSSPDGKAVKCQWNRFVEFNFAKA